MPHPRVAYRRLGYRSVEVSNLFFTVPRRSYLANRKIVSVSRFDSV